MISRNASVVRRGLTLIELLVVLAILAILIALLLPSVRTSPQAYRRVQCWHNLKQIGLALHNYHDVYGSLPPAYTVDAAGQRLHSWRTLILPYLDQAPLYAQIDLSKPWDDPVNATVCKTALPVYHCPASDSPSNQTSYLVVSAPNSCFPDAGCTKLKEVLDSTANTLMVIEADAGHAVPWMAPTDLDLASLLKLEPNSELAHSSGMTGLFADGSVRFLSASMSQGVRRAMVSIAGNDDSAE